MPPQPPPPPPHMDIIGVPTQSALCPSVVSVLGQRWRRRPIIGSAWSGFRCQMSALWYPSKRCFNVADGGPTLKQRWASVWRFPGWYTE